MADRQFKYNVNLIQLRVNNDEQAAFRDKLNAIPYLLYEVEQLSDGKKIVINKPGGKRNFGKLSKNDFAVFIYNHSESSLWLITHDEIRLDLIDKDKNNPDQTFSILNSLYRVCLGEEPDEVLAKFEYNNDCGLTLETILKVYKWIWGQEDCNYPKGEGRWLSMKGLIAEFGFTIKDFSI